jgi:predicted transposase YdaD
MPKLYDNAVKFLQTIEPIAWAKLLGIDAKTVELCNTDLSTVSSNADSLLLLGVDKSEALHIENQASYDISMGNRMLQYNVLGNKALNIPVRSVVILLRPEADGPAMNGVVRHKRVDGTPYLEFHYETVRIWEKSPGELFECGLGVMPLAFIADLKADELPELVKRADDRLRREARPVLAAELWTAIELLMGLRFKREFVVNVLKGIRAMKESDTYQAIIEEGMAKGLAEGRASEARSILIRQGRQRFGEPDAKILALINGANSLEELERMTDRVLIVSNWVELIGRL